MRLRRSELYCALCRSLDKSPINVLADVAQTLSSPLRNPLSPSKFTPTKAVLADSIKREQLKSPDLSDIVSIAPNVSVFVFLPVVLFVAISIFRW